MFYRLGLLGENISYSLSPLIMDWAFEQTGIEGEYRLYDVACSELSLELQRSDWHGLNVTVPHKTAVFQACEAYSERASGSRAVNTLFRKNGLLWGDNTDIVGFAYVLQDRLKVMAAPPKNVLVIGDGGAARAIHNVVKEQMPQAKITFASRQPKSECRAITLPEASENLDRFDLVVQATPVGSTKVGGLPLPGPLVFQPDAVVIDLVYAPRKTPFLHAAESYTPRIENGLRMLVAQAAASFEIWTGRIFPLEKAMRELLPELSSE